MAEPAPKADGFGPPVGNLISDCRFSGGKISARIRFDEISQYSSCGILMFYQPTGPIFLTAGIGGGGALFSVRSFIGSIGRWNFLAGSGDRANLEANRDYSLLVNVVGSRLTLTVDGVDVIMTILPFLPSQGQAGIWCLDVKPVHISDFSVVSEKPTAFVIMQFTKPYNELYSEVIKPVCRQEGVFSERADEAYGPGLIVADIAKKIYEAKVIVAEISPTNPNVYYEVGYAHAINKPTILIAEQGTKLPFDVSPFRTLFYENTIEGKRKIEEGFRQHLRAILSIWGT